MNTFAFSGLINGIFALGFGLFLIYKSRRERINQLFFLMTLSFAVWSFGYWQWLSSFDFNSALFWVRVLSIGSIFIPIFYFHWVAALLGQEKEKKILIFFLYLAAVIFLLFSFSDIFIKTVRPKLFFSFWPDPGPLYTFYLIFVYAGSVLYSYILLRKSYKTADESRRGQILYVFIGALFGFVGGATNFFLWYNIPLAPYGNFLVLLFPFFLGYSVVKHRLFNVRVVATELLVFTIWAFLLVRILLAETSRERLIDAGLLALVIFFGTFLIKSVLQEVRSREQIALLAKDLEKANEQLRILDEAKSEFISLAGHQLRAPLTVIKGYTSMIMEGTFGDINKKVSEALNRVFISANNLTKLVSELLDLSRIESGRIKYEFKNIYLEDVVEKVLKELEEVSKAKRVAIEFKNENKKTFSVFGDTDKIYEVVINLLDNALKYSKTSPIVVTLKPRSKRLALSVADKGMGIPRDEMPKLFIKFGRTEIAQKEQPDGMGLGLYFVKKIVEDHKGRIWVESPGLGKGSTFFVELPAK